MFFGFANFMSKCLWNNYFVIKHLNITIEIGTKRVDNARSLLFSETKQVGSGEYLDGKQPKKKVNPPSCVLTAHTERDIGAM